MCYQLLFEFYEMKVNSFFFVKLERLNFSFKSRPSPVVRQDPVGRLVAPEKTVRESSIRAGKFACRRAPPLQANSFQETMLAVEHSETLADIFISREM